MTGGKEGRSVPCWPPPGPRDSLALTASTGITLPCGPACCLCAGFLGARGPSGQGSGDGGGAGASASGQGGSAWSSTPSGHSAEPGSTRTNGARDAPTCGRPCTAPTARGAGRSTPGPRVQEGLRAPVAPCCVALDQPEGRRQGCWGLTKDWAPTCSPASVPHTAGQSPALGSSDSAHRKPQDSAAPPTYRGTQPQRPPSFPASGRGLLIGVRMCALPGPHVLSQGRRLT